jgi:hypothetical protein
MTENVCFVQEGPHGRMEYLHAIPREIPPGRVLVHNRVRAIWVNQEQGHNGFRFWLAEPSERHVRCDCGWAPQLSGHHRVEHAR